MRDSNVANAAKESTQREFSHGLCTFCALKLASCSSDWRSRKADLVASRTGFSASADRPSAVSVLVLVRRCAQGCLNLHDFLSEVSLPVRSCRSQSRADLWTDLWAQWAS